MNLRYNIILPLIIPSIFISFFPGKIILITTICMFPYLIHYSYMYYIRKKINIEIQEGSTIIKLFILYCLITFLRGLFCLHNMNDLNRMLGDYIYYFILLPLIIYYFDLKTFTSYIKQYKLYSIISIIIIYINGAGDGSSDIPHMASGFYILGFMVPYLNNKYKYIILSILFFVFITNLGTRTNIISFIFYILLIILFSYKFLLFKMRKIMAISMWVIPIIFLILGLLGIFNIFKIGDIYENSITVSGGIKKGERDLFTDSRTSIYEDVFTELSNRHAYIFGLSANGKTETSLIDITNSQFSKIYSDGRPGTESGMLNHIQYGGLIGFIFYSLLFIYASYLAIWKSNNRFTVVIGLWIAFKYILSFIEDRMAINIHYFFIIIAISICYNNRIRKLDDLEIKKFFRYIFNK